MGNKIYMRVEEVAEEMDISVSHAYKLMRQLNKELKDMGYITVAGRVDRRYFHEKFYGTNKEMERRTSNGSV